jgi:4-carboxymuconolactone decarboxylase
MPETPTFGRYTEIPYDQMTPERQEGYRSLIETRGALGGPNKIWLHNPKLAKVMGPLGAHFRTGYSLSEREREIAVVIINSKWHSIYPTNAHERAGKAAGLPTDKVEALLSGLPTSFSDTREQVVYEMATCLAKFTLDLEGALRPRGRSARPCRHHRRHLPDGLLHECLDDPRFLRRASRGDRHGALSKTNSARVRGATQISCGTELGLSRGELSVLAENRVIRGTDWKWFA